MTFKRLLVPVEDHDMMPSVLTAAVLVAERFQAYVEGIALQSVVPELIVTGPIGGFPIAPAKRDDPELAARLRRTFESGMRPHAGASAAAHQGLAWGWHGEDTVSEGYVASYARVFDLTIFARPGGEGAGSQLNALESTLFESGRPVLVVPPRAPGGLGEKVLIAWNGSTETAHAVAFAMPFLTAAREVTVLSVEEGALSGPSGEQLALHLKAHGIAARLRTVGPERRKTSDAILADAAAIGCDLIIKGAYTQSRFKQMIFGGPTSHILAAAEVPVLFAH